MKKTKIKKDLSNKIKEIGSGNKIRGITLISLVITIVVLIILAGVIISITLGNGGIIDRAKLAKQEYANAQGYEQTEIAKYSNNIDEFVGNGRGDIVDSGTNYVIYSNGLKMCWGEISITANTNGTVVNLPIQMSTTNYMVQVSHINNETLYHTFVPASYDRETNKFKIGMWWTYPDARTNTSSFMIGYLVVGY